MIAMFKLFYNTIAACQRPVGPLLSNKCMSPKSGTGRATLRPKDQRSRLLGEMWKSFWHTFAKNVSIQFHERLIVKIQITQIGVTQFTTF